MVAKPDLLWRGDGSQTRDTYCMHLVRRKFIVFLALKPSIILPVALLFLLQNAEKIEMVKKERQAVIQFLAQRESGLPALAKVAQATHATHIPIGASYILFLDIIPRADYFSATLAHSPIQVSV